MTEEKATEPAVEPEPEPEDQLHPFERMLQNYRSANPVYSEDDVLNAATELFTDDAWQ